jgi:plasmid stability protein
MTKLLIRRLDDEVLAKLKSRAERHRVSLEEEARAILSRELTGDKVPQAGLGTRMANLFRALEDEDPPFPEFPREPLRR